MQTIIDIPNLCEQIKTGAKTGSVNLNSYATKDEEMRVVPAESKHTVAICTAIADAGNNCGITELFLSNAQIRDDAAPAVARMIECNSSIEKLNLETNHFSGDAIVQILGALKDNKTLLELKLTNQSKMITSTAERSVQKLIEPNETLVKLSISMREQSSRNALDRVIFRNKDYARKRRVEAKYAKERAEREAAKAAAAQN